MRLDCADVNRKMEEYPVKGASITIIEEYGINMVKNYGVKNSIKEGLIDKNSVFNACSMSKFATALLALNLVKEGLLQLDQDVNSQLRSWKVPENEYTRTHKVTLRNLLSHQAGFIDPEESFGEYDSELGKPSVVDLLEGKSDYCSQRAEVKYEPGRDFIYSDLGYCLIELLIMDVTGKPYKDLIEKLIFKPLGMNDSRIIDEPIMGVSDNFTFGHTKDGHVTGNGRAIYPYPAAAGLWCTSRDLALMLIEVFNLLRGCGKLYIPPNLIREMVKPQGCSPWTGLGVFLDTVETNLEITSFGWGIGYQCMMIGFPDKGTGAVIMTNTDTGVHQLKGFIGEVVASIF